MASKRGLAMRELIVIIVASAVLLLLIGFIPLTWRERALHADCSSNLHQIGMALTQYAQNNGGLYPAVPGVVKATETAPGRAAPGDGEASLKLLYNNVYIPSERDFWCVNTPPRPGRFSSFDYDPRHQATDPAAVAIVGERGGGKRQNSPNHGGDGQNVLFVDCHVEWKKTTNVGYQNDEIYVRNDELNNRDSWLIE